MVRPVLDELGTGRLLFESLRDRAEMHQHITVEGAGSLKVNGRKGESPSRPLEGERKFST